MNQRPGYNKPLHRFALFTTISTFVLLVAGGLVTSTGSGLAVPDWPLSYGQVMPPMVGGIFYEHGHRMIATFVGMLTVVLAIWLWKKESRRWVRRLGVIALGAVILQGLLGGLTVIFLLPTTISVSHATIAQTFFCIVAALTLFTSRWWYTDHPVQSKERTTGVLIAGLFLSGSIAIQLILGALMRHTQSGLAVPDFPLAYGFLLPPLDADSIDRYNALLMSSNIRIFADGFITEGQIVVHLLHRYWALVVLTLSGWTAFKAFRSKHSRLRILAFFVLGFLLVQMTLGALTVLLRKEVWLTTAHVANGAVLLCLAVLMVLHAARLGGISLNTAAGRLFQKEALA